MGYQVLITDESPKKINLALSSGQLIKEIWRLLTPYRTRFLVASIIRLIGDIGWLYPAFAFASIVTFLTQYKAGESLNPLWIELALWFLALIARSLSQYYSKYLGYNVAERVARDASLETIQHLFQLDMAWHEKENAGNKIKRIQNAADGFNRIIRLWFNCIIEIVVNLVAMNIIIGRFDLTVLLVLAGFLVTYFCISSVMTKRAGEASRRVNLQEEQVQGTVFESITNIRTVKVMAMARALYASLQESYGVLIDKLGIRIFWYQSRNSVLSFWTGVFKIGIICLIIKGILNGHYEVGFLVLFNSYFSDLRASIDELSTAGIDFLTSKISIARMRHILDEPILIESKTGKTSFPEKWKTLTIRDVSFAYGNNEVLSNISFEVKRGEKVGIVGLSGAGKSTLFKLLLKEREEFTGEIFFDDVPLRDILARSYFSYVSVVLQDTEVFNLSLRDNITIANISEVENEKLLEGALTVAHISDFLGKLPQGVDTIIGEKGMKLSGGERQRLGIARAIFKQPQILLLDEATSHLDMESEDKIRDSLHRFFEGVTAIVIAHRLTTIKEMDRILVIEDGKLIESGSFDDLYKRRGRFFSLWERQKAKKASEEKLDEVV